MKNRIPLWLLASFALAILTSGYSIYQRHRVESRNKAVSLAAEYETIESLGAAQGQGAEAALQNLKGHGLNAVVLNEETIGDLLASGQATLMSHTWTRGLSFEDSRLGRRISKGLQIRFGGLEPNGNGTGFQNFVPIPAQLDEQVLRSVSVGLDPAQAELAKSQGMLIIGRFANPEGLSDAGVRATLAWGHDLGAQVYLPVGEQVLGRRDGLKNTEETLRALGMEYAAPEFAKIGGDANIVSDAPDLVIRLHSAQVAELDKMSNIDCVERYGKAARERNMRILLLRPISYSGPAPLDEMGEFVGQVGQMVVRQGGQIAQPHPFTGPDLPRWWPILVSLSFAPVVWFAASVAIGSLMWRRVGAVLLFLVCLAGYTKSGAQVDAFLASLAFPFAGYVLLDRLRPKSVIVGFLLVSVISLIGGLCVAGTLNGLSYYVQADEFRGVKLSIFLPVLLVGAYFFVKLVDWKATLKSPITWGTAALGLALLVVLAVVIERTGNDAAVGASDMELLFRNVLDRWLYVRPRTKEIFVGHPLLVIGCGLLLTYGKKAASDPKAQSLAGWTALALMVSAIGQTDIVNTLSHIHIPVFLSIVRDLEGMVIGCIIGFVLWTAIKGSILRKAN